jgi:hypothetical protein
VRVIRFSPQYFAIQHKYNLKKTKMKTTLTIENLIEIYNAMVKIKPIDRSDFFNNYFDEVKIRINSLTNNYFDEAKIRINGLIMDAEIIKKQMNKDEKLQNL